MTSIPATVLEPVVVEAEPGASVQVWVHAHSERFPLGTPVLVAELAAETFTNGGTSRSSSTPLRRWRSSRRP